MSATTMDNDIFIIPFYTYSSQEYTKQPSRKSTEEERISFNNDIATLVGKSDSAYSLEREVFLTRENEKIEQRIAIDNNSINLSIINNKLDIIESIGDNWDDEGSIKGPNDFSIKFSRELAFKITENSFMPSVVTQSAEEGICFVFKSGNKFLYIEIYNDRELGLIIEDYLNKKTLKNMSIESSNDIIKEINSFYYL